MLTGFVVCGLLPSLAVQGVNGLVEGETSLVSFGCLTAKAFVRYTLIGMGA